jgi:hypothetical protein
MIILTVKQVQSYGVQSPFYRWQKWGTKRLYNLETGLYYSVTSGLRFRALAHPIWLRRSFPYVRVWPKAHVVSVSPGSQRGSENQSVLSTLEPLVLYWLIHFILWFLLSNIFTEFSLGTKSYASYQRYQDELGMVLVLRRLQSRGWETVNGRMAHAVLCQKEEQVLC